MADHEIPKTMRAVTIPLEFSFKTPATAHDLVLSTDFPTPTPTPEQCLILVYSVGISRFELTWQGSYTSNKPRIPVFDVAGTIVSSPEGCEFKPGDQVFGLFPWGGQGGLAEYAVCEPKYLARIPLWHDPYYARFPFEYAAVIPRAALTAWQALKVELGGVVKPGMNVLVTGASGAVGRFGVQLARSIVGPMQAKCASTVIAYGKTMKSTMGKDRDEMLKFADFYVAHRSSVTADGTVVEEDWVPDVKKCAKVDVVFDTLGGEVLEKSLELVKDDGFEITVASPIPNFEYLGGASVARKRGVKMHFFVVQESGEQLKEIAEMVQNGSLKPVVGAMIDDLSEKSVQKAWTRVHDVSGGTGINIRPDPRHAHLHVVS